MEQHRVPMAEPSHYHLPQDVEVRVLSEHPQPQPKLDLWRQTGLAAHASAALTVSLVRKHKGAETRLFANSHLFQLSSQSVTYKPHKEAVAARIDDKEATIVLPVRVDPSLASIDLQTESKPTLVRTLLDVAMNGKAEQSIIDVWSVRDAEKDLSALVRVKKGAVSDFLRASGSQGTLVDSPKEMRNEQDLVWLRDTKGENDTLESAHEKKSKIQDCLGLITAAGNSSVLCP